MMDDHDHDHDGDFNGEDFDVYGDGDDYDSGGGSGGGGGGAVHDDDYDDDDHHLYCYYCFRWYFFIISTITIVMMLMMTTTIRTMALPVLKVRTAQDFLPDTFSAGFSRGVQSKRDRDCSLLSGGVTGILSSTGVPKIAKDAADVGRIFPGMFFNTHMEAPPQA